MPLRTPFAQNLRSALAEHHLTQQQIASMIGVSNRAVSGWCLGEHEPHTASLNRLVYLLEHDHEWFFTDHSASSTP